MVLHRSRTPGPQGHPRSIRGTGVETPHERAPFPCWDDLRALGLDEGYNKHKMVEMMMGFVGRYRPQFYYRDNKHVEDLSEFMDAFHSRLMGEEPKALLEPSPLEKSSEGFSE
jgi:hypothetical protein